MEQWQFVVIGSGPAGLTAAFRAAERGVKTILVEKSRKAGVKILMSGGTRCNLTHAVDRQEIVEAFGSNGRFLHSALARLDPWQVIELFEAEGVPVKYEPNGKVFPQSDKALDVLNALLARLRRSPAELALALPVTKIERHESGFYIEAGARRLRAESVLVATGGKSYPGCGTTGDGYSWAEAFGHTIVPLRPALTPLTLNVEWVQGLSGVTMPDMVASVVELPAEGQTERVLGRRRGALLFTHFGLSGPLAMDLSGHITRHAERKRLRLTCDFLPDRTDEELARGLIAEARTSGSKQALSHVAGLVPQRLAEALLQWAEVSPTARAAEVGKAVWGRVAQSLKHLQLPVTGTLGFEKAEVTTGGVALSEVDSRTMQSKMVPGLYFAGEVLDLDGPIGGYNFQAAFSTGWLAGESVGG